MPLMSGSIGAPIAVARLMGGKEEGWRAAALGQGTTGARHEHGTEDEPCVCHAQAVFQDRGQHADQVGLRQRSSIVTRQPGERIVRARDRGCGDELGIRETPE
jgi:hypothetical protein